MCVAIITQRRSKQCGASARAEKLVKKCVAFNIHQGEKNSRKNSMINAVSVRRSLSGDQRTIVKTHKNTCKKESKLQNRSSTSQNDIFCSLLCSYEIFITILIVLSSFNNQLFMLSSFIAPRKKISFINPVEKIFWE
jgi:hypothetical protein